MDELKACPFCGGKAHLFGIGKTLWVECESEDCVGTHIYRTPQQAIDVWNRRAETPANDVGGEKDNG